MKKKKSSVSPRSAQFETHSKSMTGYRGRLVDFVYTKSRAYEEPTRRGKRFSAIKYAATLYELTSLYSKDVAKKLRLSYDVLRQWRGDPAFKKLVAEHEAQFVEDFWNYMIARCRATIPREWVDRDFRVLGPMLYSRELDLQAREMLRDAPLYSRRLINALIKSLELRVYKIGGWGLALRVETEGRLTLDMLLEKKGMHPVYAERLLDSERAGMMTILERIGRWLDDSDSTITPAQREEYALYLGKIVGNLSVRKFIKYTPKMDKAPLVPVDESKPLTTSIGKQALTPDLDERHRK